LRDRKTNFRSIIYRQGSTKPENLVKIGQVHVEITGLREIVLKMINEKQRQNRANKLRYEKVE